jgi:NitT/TauT family transport system permease protein
VETTQLGSPVASRAASASPNVGSRFFGRARRRALVSLLVVLLVWQLGASSSAWFGFRMPWLGRLPTPVEVLVTWRQLLDDPGYWRSWAVSFLRVLLGFSVAALVGVPFGLLLALKPLLRATLFPVFELFRPVPPLAWVPAAIIFWPTQWLSIAFVIFLGAFYPIVVNVLGGVKTLDVRFVQAARSMGASNWNVFRRLLLPALLPSICAGMEVGMGITWEVVVAAEMISGGGSGSAAASGGGLGFFIWSSYVGGSYPQIIVGMLSIGIAGYMSSAGVRWLTGRMTPWLKER